MLSNNASFLKGYRKKTTTNVCRKCLNFGFSGLTKLNVLFYSYRFIKSGLQ